MVPSRHGLLTTLAHRLGPSAEPSYALEGSVAVAGLGISWLRDNLRIIDSADDSEPIANSVGVGREGNNERAGDAEQVWVGNV